MPSNKFERDIMYLRRFDRQIKRICGEHLMGEPPLMEDLQHNTDLLVLRMDNIRVGCRVRRETDLKGRNQFNAKDKATGRLYRYEFTIRYDRRRRDVKTKYAKILEPWGDYFLYGWGRTKLFGIRDEHRLFYWTLADLDVFRKAIADGVQGELHHNGDGSSDFLAFGWDQFPEEFVIESSWRQGGLFGEAG